VAALIGSGHGFHGAGCRVPDDIDAWSRTSRLRWPHVVGSLGHSGLRIPGLSFVGQDDHHRSAPHFSREPQIPSNATLMNVSFGDGGAITTTAIVPTCESNRFACDNVSLYRCLEAPMKPSVPVLMTFLFIAGFLWSEAPAQETDRPRVREVGIRPGVLSPGPLNGITDVEGVAVGHTTIVRGDDVRTGVTAILPHEGNIFRQKVPGAVFIGNAFGKLAGST
jgi:hypothetical protein